MKFPHCAPLSTSYASYNPQMGLKQQIIYRFDQSCTFVVSQFFSNFEVCSFYELPLRDDKLWKFHAKKWLTACSKSIQKRDDCRLHQKVICSPTEIEIVELALLDLEIGIDLRRRF